MSNHKLAAPELAAVEVSGHTRQAFIMRGAVAAGSVYGLAAVGPFVGRAIAQGGGGDVEILNFALTLEILESVFYEQALAKTNGLSPESKELATEIGKNEAEHVEALTATIKELGGKPAPAPMVDFGDAFASEKSFLKLAQTFEDTGVSAYNGAAPQIQSPDVLAAAGGIVQVEARHAAGIRLLRGDSPAPDAFDKTLSMDQVLKAVQPFGKS